jgi:Tol biopolymer transport system component
MKRLTVLGAVIALGLACGGDGGDGAVFIVTGGTPDCGPGNILAWVAQGDIFYSDEYGRKVTRVTDTKEIYEENPCWSPDGARIAYEARYRHSQVGGIFVVPKDGGAPVQLTRDRGRFPAWSPDGRTIVYNDPDDYDIWAVATAGGESERLTTSGYYHLTARASDGNIRRHSGSPTGMSAPRR